jgi:hypothetical protein
MKKKFIIGSVCALVVIALLIGTFWYFHPTHYKFNDQFILGSSQEEITQKYGDFFQTGHNDRGELTQGSYLIRSDTPEWIMGYDNSLWYDIYFQDGIAVEVQLREGWPGG